MSTENPNKPEGEKPTTQEGQQTPCDPKKPADDELDVVIDPEEEKKKGDGKKTGTKLVDSGVPCPPVAA